MANNMVGKMFKVAIGTRESLNKCGKILQQVDCFIDGESGTLYIVPQKDDSNGMLDTMISEINTSFENIIKIWTFIIFRNCYFFFRVISKSFI